MSRYNLPIPATQRIKDAFMSRFKLEVDEGNLFFAWGFDAPTGGYFCQIGAERAEHDDVFIEDGLIGGSKIRVIERLEKYGILEHIRKLSPNHFTNLCLDLPF